MPQGREKNSPLALVLVTGAAGYFFWRLATPDAPREFSLVQGRTYEFTLVAHPYGDPSEWWSAARDALVESGASLVTQIASNPSDVQIRFLKASPVTATLLPHTVLYPNTPELATATLLSAKPSASSSALPLGTSSTVSGRPTSQPPKKEQKERGRAAHYERLAQQCEADARKPHLSSEQELNLELAKQYRARAARHRATISGRPRTNEDIARHWEAMATQCEADAKNPRHKKVRELNLELARDARKKAADTRAGRGAWDHDT